MTLSVQVTKGLDEDQPERLRKEQHVKNNDQVESVLDGIWIRGSHAGGVLGAQPTDLESGTSKREGIGGNSVSSSVRTRRTPSSEHLAPGIRTTAKKSIRGSAPKRQRKNV